MGPFEQQVEKAFLSEEYEHRGWLATLGEPKLKKALKVLGDIHKKQEQYDKRARDTQPRYGEVAVGGGHFDYFLKSEIFRAFYSAISKGEDPDAAKRTTEQLRTDAVKKWNARRGKDFQTHRADTAEQATIDHIWRQFKQL